MLDNADVALQGGLVSTSEPDRRRFGRLLAELRHNKGESQATVADVVGVTPQNVSGWENGDYAPSERRTVAALDKHLGGEGRLLEALGYSTKPSVDARITDIEQRLDRLTAAVERLARRRLRDK